MRIAYFDFVTHFGGMQQCMAFTCQRLKATDEVHVVDPYGVCELYGKALNEAQITTHVLDPQARRTYVGYQNRPLTRLAHMLGQSGDFRRLCRRLTETVTSIDPDVICTSSFKALFFLAVCRRLRRYPIAFYVHGWWTRERTSWWGRWLLRRRATSVLAVSKATKTALTDWGVRPDSIHVVYHCIDFDEILRVAERGTSTAPPASDRYPRILVPGTLLYTKGQHTAVEAAHLLKERGIDPVMWLAGDVPPGGRSDYADHLRELIRTHDLHDNVFLLGWRDDVPALAQAADLVAFPTHSEGLGRVIEEAMLVRRPVDHPSGGVTDLIIQGETGLLTAVNDAPGLADAIERLIKDRELYQRIVNNGHRQMYERFSLDKQIALVRQGLHRAMEPG